MNGFRSVPHAITMVDTMASTTHAEKQELLDGVLDLLAELGGKTRHLASLSCDDGVTDLENQRALRWIDETLEDVAATAVGVAMSYTDWGMSGEARRRVRGLC